MKLTKLEPKFIEKHNPRIGLITLASDLRIEKDFNDVIHEKEIDHEHIISKWFSSIEDKNKTKIYH